jgi:hypothetical protein
MNEATKSAVRIRPNLGSYVNARSSSGSKVKISGDPASEFLKGMTLGEVYEVAKFLGIDRSYTNLNPGHQRMCLGNMIRTVMKKGVVELPTHIREAADERIANDVGLREAKLAERVAKAAAKAEKKAAALTGVDPDFVEPEGEGKKSRGKKNKGK